MPEATTAHCGLIPYCYTISLMGLKISLVTVVVMVGSIGVKVRTVVVMVGAVAMKVVGVLWDNSM